MLRFWSLISKKHILLLSLMSPMPDADSASYHLITINNREYRSGFDFRWARASARKVPSAPSSLSDRRKANQGQEKRWLEHWTQAKKEWFSPALFIFSLIIASFRRRWSIRMEEACFRVLWFGFRRAHFQGSSRIEGAYHSFIPTCALHRLCEDLRTYLSSYGVLSRSGTFEKS